MQYQTHRLCIAPMMDWTDRHCRYFHRMISRRALLYTEMIAAAAVIHGPRERLLAFSPEEKPLALQLGGSDPAELAEAVRIAVGYGFNEINLNVGCPSDRVRKGAFGACLMREPQLVADCCAAMRAAAMRERGAMAPEITVKCRIGVDEQDPRQALPVFMDAVAGAGVRVFIIHARKAWLRGLSPKENRVIPPLDYAVAREMKRRRPELFIVLNGGIEHLDDAAAQLSAGVDGVMLGRAAYQRPYDILSAVDRRLFGAPTPRPKREEVIARMCMYIESRRREGVRLQSITRHMFGLFAGAPGARRWRRHLSEASLHEAAGGAYLDQAPIAEPAMSKAD